MGRINTKKYLIGGALIGVSWVLYILYLYGGNSDVYTRFG